MASRPKAPAEPVQDAALDRASRKVVDLEHYAPAYLTWIANKLAHGASKAYRDVFSVGIETWRLLVLLAIEPELTAQSICRIIGMDKASVSRTLKSMQRAALVNVGLDPRDGRYRVVSITRKGRELHDGILSIALERERALLSVLSADEQTLLLSMLRRLHENLPVVEQRTAAYLAAEFPQQMRKRRRTPTSKPAARGSAESNGAPKRRSHPASI